MTTPRNSMSVAFPAEPARGPISVHPSQKLVPRKMSPIVGPTQSFFLREAKALGAVQIMNGLFHLALGSLLLVHMEVYTPICMALWYPIWGGIMYIISGSLLVAAEKSSKMSLIKGKMMMNSLSLFAAISGIILLIMDIFNITISHFFKMESLHLIKVSTPYLNIYNCQQADPAEENSLSTQHCYSMRSVFLSIFAVMLVFVFLQKLVTAGTVETEWKKMCSRPKANVILLSAEDKKEQVVEMKEEMVELTEVSSQPPNEEEIEIMPIQEEEEEETEINFPEPPQDEAPLPIETESTP
ncbi:PREDICTED: B-lymphocyte antigen CD20 [Condylura cristata]|uniref:B-lymphocyte antigen CD20 n=1 Tax=Condylura cristata TaxID=143302 RepID=UPI0003346114|nr:PREDICTED: B-lymphocyte antigen CD20 [Condylura cristata]